MQLLLNFSPKLKMQTYIQLILEKKESTNDEQVLGFYVFIKRQPIA